MARKRTPPPVTIGDRAFIDVYPQWQQLCDYFEAAIEQEIASGRVPRSYMADRNRFLQFFTTHVKARPDLGVSQNQISDLVDFIHDEFFGIGVLGPWLDDPGVEDIILDDWRAMDVSKNGQKHRVSPTPWVDDADVYQWMQRILSAQGRQLSEYNPIESGRLADGSRLQFVVPPVTKHCSFSIRKHRVERFNKEAYPQSGVGPAEFFVELQQWVERKRNIIVSGATGSGKTTLLNYLGSLIDEWDRIIVVEDTPELQIPHWRALSMAATNRGARAGQDRSDTSAITLQHLVMSCLRMKPDRIIVGEVRGAEAFELLRAMSTGHSGSMSTLHANTPIDALLTIEALAAPAAPNMPTWALQDRIGRNVEIAMQMMQVPHSSRRSVVEVVQVLHPSKLKNPDDLDKCQEVRKDTIYTHTLWLWNSDTEQLEKVGNELETTGHYMH